MKQNVSKQIEKLKQAAKAQGLQVRFRDHKTDQGDFCIFIYDRANFRKSYAVGYDGDWEGAGVGFEKCLKSAYNWLQRRDKRFTFRGGRWQYGHYHFIVWKDGEGSDRDHYLTVEDADKAASELTRQGYCVVCYDQQPEGNSQVFKVYGDYECHTNDYVKKSIRNSKTVIIQL